MNINKIKEYYRKPHLKVLVENFLSLSLLQVLNYLLPLVTLPYLTRVIGVAMFGRLAIAAAIAIYFQTFVDFGFDYTAARDVAKMQKDIASVSRIFWTITCAKIILTFISILILLPLLLFIPYLHDHALLILLTFMYVPIRILFPEWFFQGMEKMKYITILNVIAKVLFTALIFVVIRKQEDYIYQPVLIAGGYLVSGLFSLYLMFRQFKIIIYRPTIRDIKKALIDSFDIFINLLMPNLYNSFSTLLLGYWWGNSIAGILDAGKKVINLSDQAFGVLNRTFFPYLANNLNNHHKFWKISLAAGIAFMLAYIIGADFIVRFLFSTEFAGTKTIILIMSVSPVLFVLMDAFGPNYLILIHKEKTLRNITLFSSLIGFALALVLVYYFKHIGAALTLVIIWALRGGLCYYYSMKYKLKPASE